MDQTERPVKISKEFSIYAEKHQIYETFKRLLTSLVVKMPVDPLSFMLDFFQDLREAPKILVIGPRCSGKTALCRLISKKFGCELVNLEKFNAEDFRRSEEQSVKKVSTQVLETNMSGADNLSRKERENEDEDDVDGDERDDVETEMSESYAFAQSINNKEKESWSKNDVWMEKLEWLEKKKKGWVLDGGVTDKEKAMRLCNAGFFPTHTIILEAPTKVLVARAAERIDQLKSDDKAASKIVLKNNQNFNARNPKEVQKLLDEMVDEVEEFCHQKTILTETFKHSVKTFNSDQPLHDLYKKVLSFLCQPRRSIIPFTPRVLLLSPPGTCVDDVATALANKYNINLVSFEEAKENEIMKKTKLGEIFSLCQQTCSPDPDEVMFDLVDQQLNAIEVDSRGWLVTGFPSNIDQCEFFYAAGYEPNRVFFLEMDDNKIFENFKRTLGNGAEEDPLNDRNFHKRGILSKDELCYKLTNYRLHEAEIKKFYREESFEVDALMNLDNIVQCMEAIVVNPLPICHDDEDDVGGDKGSDIDDRANNSNNIRVKKISMNNNNPQNNEMHGDVYENVDVSGKDKDDIKIDTNTSNNDNLFENETLISQTTNDQYAHIETFGCKDEGYNRHEDDYIINNAGFIDDNNAGGDNNIKKTHDDDKEDDYKTNNFEEIYKNDSDKSDNEDGNGDYRNDVNDNLVKNYEFASNMNKNDYNENEFSVTNNFIEEEEEEDDDDGEIDDDSDENNNNNDDDNDINNNDDDNKSDG